jgi:hypothetical protein
LDFKNRLILFFILIAIIPIIALSAVSTVTIIKLKDQVANIYSGYVTNVELLSKNKGDLLGIKSDLIQVANSQDSTQRKAGIAHIISLKNEIGSTMVGYKTLENLPGDFLPTKGIDLSKISADETVLVEEIGLEWKGYSSKLEDLAILYTDPLFSAQSQTDSLQLAAQTDKLISSYDALLEVDHRIGEASRAQSQQVMQLAFFYGGLASAISAACATAAAILVSRRVVLGDLVRMTKLDLIETTLRDLIGGGSDALLQTIKVQMMQEEEGRHAYPRTVSDVPSVVVPSTSEDDIVIGKKKTKAFIDEDDPSALPGKPKWEFANDDSLKVVTSASGADKTKVSSNEREGRLLASKGDYRGKLVILNTARFGPAAKAREELLADENVIIITRRGSNIYREARDRSRLYYILTQSSGVKDGKKKDERVIPSDSEEKIIHAIESIIEENPKSTILIDSATELIYTLGFEAAFSLLRRISEVVSSYDAAGVVILLNTKAHESRMIEAIGNIANEFVD